MRLQIKSIKQLYYLYKKLTEKGFFYSYNTGIKQKIIYPLYSFLIEKMELKMNIEGYKMIYSCYCFPGPELFLIGHTKICHEEPLFSLFKSTLEKGMTVVDIGASSGYFTLKACEKVGDEGQVLSFEPDKKRFPMLKRNVQLNNYRNVRLFNLAIDRKTDLKSIVDAADIVTIDVEGSEYWTLKAMDNLLKQENIKILIEMHPKYISKEDHSKIYNLLKKHHFKFLFARMGDDGFTNDRKRIEEEKIYYLFVQKD